LAISLAIDLRFGLAISLAIDLRFGLAISLAIDLPYGFAICPAITRLLAWPFLWPVVMGQSFFVRKKKVDLLVLTVVVKVSLFQFCVRLSET